MHKIQHAYGWNDEEVLNLTLARAVQMKEAIEQHEEFSRWEQNKVLEWQTRSVAAVIANTVQDDKAREALVSFVNSLSLTPSDDTKSDRGMSRKGTTKNNKAVKMYKTLDGKEVPASELHNYSYNEIDHSEEERELVERARKKNAGKNIMAAFGPK